MISMACLAMKNMLQLIITGSVIYISVIWVVGHRWSEWCTIEQLSRGTVWENQAMVETFKASMGVSSKLIFIRLIDLLSLEQFHHKHMVLPIGLHWNCCAQWHRVYKLGEGELNNQFHVTKI